MPPPLFRKNLQFIFPKAPRRNFLQKRVSISNFGLVRVEFVRNMAKLFVISKLAVQSQTGVVYRMECKIGNRINQIYCHGAPLYRNPPLPPKKKLDQKSWKIFRKKLWLIR